MKINEGMYVRTLNGFISKIIEFKNEPISSNEIILIKGNYKGDKDEEYGYKRNYYKENTSFIYRGEIIKASNNIIDLIEEGDYVNGYKVLYILKRFKILVDKPELNTYDGNYYLKQFTNDEIKSIVTKEVFKANEYRMETD